MPHISLEYSLNLETVVDVAKLCDVLRRAAINTEVFPLAGVRVRALPCAHYSIADGASHHGFIDISVRLRAGRPQEVRKEATAAIFAAAEAFLAPVMAARPLALSLEMRDIDPVLSPKSGTIRHYLEGKG
ncbi:MAG: 5-carboxymethyl-2-hydroxymuconate Delta-isomerase [Rhodobacteraceae bacterium]|nr:5-carboxymethyl-2-hydroxymuconate Delta-isomerase [Paracoccaceae bacterium]